jgi:hypothetical protein
MFVKKEKELGKPVAKFPNKRHRKIPVVT